MKEFDKLLFNIGRMSGAVKPVVEAIDKGSDVKSACEGAVKVLPPRPEYQELIALLKDAGDEKAVKAACDKFLESLNTIDSRSAFKLYDTYGFPIEITVELANEKGLKVDEEGFAERFKQHQQTSHAGAEQKFASGMADHQDETIKLHTATHLLHAALRQVLGDEVAQKGSNITTERLRFDFSFGRKMTDEEKKEVERLVNEYIQAAAPITCEEMTVAEAKAQGAIGLFESKYGERVKVYTMGQFSKEICGGPHASNTGDLKSFKIKKEEASSAGVRRIKATIGE
ncbi:MAG: hypothetical protein IJI59_09570 [Clostridia bacterium]|nr:hypothetical protein [Clostridia bacterium]